MVKAVVDTNNEKNHIPDYTFELQDDLFIIRPRSEFSDINAEPETVAAIDQIRLPDTAYRNTRKHAAGCDIYFLEREGGTCLVVSNPSHKILVVQLWTMCKTMYNETERQNYSFKWLRKNDSKDS